ncbi:MAG: hypothetical protein ACTSVB_08030 [Candidatus Heimdallarchaeaceae archaeon]
MSLYVYLVILVMLFVITLCYNVFSPVFVGMESDIHTLINETENSTVKDDTLDTLGVVSDVWKYAVVFFLFSLILWGVVATQKEEPHYY